MLLVRHDHFRYVCSQGSKSAKAVTAPQRGRAPAVSPMATTAPSAGASAGFPVHVAQSMVVLCDACASCNIVHDVFRTFDR